MTRWSQYTLAEMFNGLPYIITAILQDKMALVP